MNKWVASVLLLAAAGYGQEIAGSISGTVLDPSGTGVPGAADGSR